MLKKIWMTMTALCLCMLLMICSVALAEEMPQTELTEAEIEARLQALTDEEIERALANAEANVVGDPRLIERGKLTAYVGGKDTRYYSADYSIKDCMVAVGEQVVFDVEVQSAYSPVYYMASALVLDEEFNKITQADGKMKVSTSKSFKNGWTYDTSRAGYVMFIFTALDKYDNSVTFSSCTVQVSYPWDDPTFDNMAIDNELGIRLSLDKNKIKVGETVTATCIASCDVGPIDYVGGWTLYDENINALESKEFVGSSQGAGTRMLTFSYTPTKAGEVVLLIVFADGAGNQLTFNTIGVEVEGSETLTGSITTDKKSLNQGESATATYNIAGHSCSSAKIVRGVKYYRGGKQIGIDQEETQERSGSFTWSPRLGDEVGFFVEVSCNHSEFYYFGETKITLKNGLNVTLNANASSATSGKPISVTYSVSGGLKPYQNIIVRGYSYGKNLEYTPFMQRPNVAASGTESGTPYLGEYVYFEVEVTEADGVTTYTWIEDIPLKGAPAAQPPKLAASVNKQSFVTGEEIVVSYSMTGGAGTIFSGQDGATGSVAALYKADGTWVADQKITEISGKATFKVTEPGEYLVYVLMKDGYAQEVEWESEVFMVEAAPAGARVPGDANEDGYTDIFDALTILQAQVGWDVKVNESNGDVNADGYCDIFDALVILQAQVGWDVTLK